MVKSQTQSLDLRPGKRFGVGLSNENLRIGSPSAWDAKIAGTLDLSRTSLDFEVGKGGVIKELDRSVSVPKRIKSILAENGIQDPNIGLSDEQLRVKGSGVRTYASFVLQGSHDTMVKLAFGDQEISYNPAADNSHLKREEGIENWAKDMYAFIAGKYGEKNIALFAVHLDETTPHAHCVVVPVTEEKKLSFKEVFSGNSKYEFSKRMKELWDEAAKVSRKYGMERGESKVKTGAEHKSYLQWMREQIYENRETIEQQSSTIEQQSSTIEQQGHTIDEQKQEIYALNAEIKKTQKKLKALQTMLQNLENQRGELEIQVTALEELYSNGEINNAEMERRSQELSRMIADVEARIETRRRMLSETETRLRFLASERNSLQGRYDSLMRDYVRLEVAVMEKTKQEMRAVLWKEAEQQLKKEYSSLEAFSDSLSSEQRREFNDIMDNSLLEDIARAGADIVNTAAALFLGYLDQATTIAHGGGGGGNPGKGWGRDKDEDDDSFRRRCCIMGRMMMKPAGKRLKR